LGIAVTSLATSVAAGSSAHAQTYPPGPVKFITQLAAGGGTDPAMRIVTEHLGRIWGHDRHDPIARAPLRQQQKSQP
jgi:tripartite-type tricarboxylate transporter receptor subunit TctC